MGKKTQQSIEDDLGFAQETLIDSISASSRIPFFTYPGGGYGKHRDIS